MFARSPDAVRQRKRSLPSPKQLAGGESPRFAPGRRVLRRSHRPPVVHLFYSVRGDRCRVPRRHAKGTGRVEPDEKSLAEVLKDLSEQTANLVHQDVELAKAEMSVKGKLLAAGPGLSGARASLAFWRSPPWWRRHRGTGRGAAGVAGGLDRGRRVWPPWQESWLSSARAKCGGDRCPCPKRRWRARRRMWNG